jgi:hypothetical protein
MSRQQRPTVDIHHLAALKPEQVGALCGGMSDDWVRDLVDRGVLRPVPHTRTLLIARAEVDRWLASNLHESDSDTVRRLGFRPTKTDRSVSA